jgi:putative SOS response-associated peptidase YedK
MCSRYRLVKEKIVITINGREIEIAVRARFNIGPQQEMPALLPNLLPVEMKWGWQTPWSKTLLINAQAETLTEKPTFKKFLHQRCLLPADGFYEWTSDKTPIMFTRATGEPFCFAGLWMEQAARKQFIILTTTPNKTVGSVHNRMPFIVQPEQYGLWLAEDETYRTVLGSPDKTELQSQPVQRDLNNVRNEGPELIRPPATQQELF